MQKVEKRILRAPLTEMAACPSNFKWVQLDTAETLSEERVKVTKTIPFPRAKYEQYFYVEECNNTDSTWQSITHRELQRDCPNCCYGINHKK